MVATPLYTPQMLYTFWPHEDEVRRGLHMTQETPLRHAGVFSQMRRKLLVLSLLLIFNQVMHVYLG